MGRLEDIIERNRKPKANRERITVGIGFGLFLLVIIALMVFTDLGIPDKSQDPGFAPEGSGVRGVPDVQLRPAK